LLGAINMVCKLNVAFVLALSLSSCATSTTRMASVGPQIDAKSDREYALSQNPQDVGLNPASTKLRYRKIWGVVMDVHSKNGLMTIVAYPDGSARLITTQWNSSYISAGHPAVEYSAKNSVRLVDSYLQVFTTATDHSSPPEGYLKIFVLSSPNLLSTQNYPIDEISKKGHPLFDLYCALYDVGVFQIHEPSM